MRRNTVVSLKTCCIPAQKRLALYCNVPYLCSRGVENIQFSSEEKQYDHELHGTIFHESCYLIFELR